VARIVLLLALALLAACQPRARVEPKPMKDALHQSNVDFDYLGDDDDDDDSGGAGGNVFDATINASLPSSAAVGAAIAFQVDATAGGGAQTVGAVRVTITESSGARVGSVSTVGLAGWSETGWSYDATNGIWSNTLSKASVAVGTTSPTFSVTASSGGSGGGLVVATNLTAPHTAEATGTGNLRIVLIGSVSTFDALVQSVASTMGVGTVPTITVRATASGTAQTNGSFRVSISDAPDADSLTVSAIDFVDTAGWSYDGWARTGGVWRCNFTRTTVPLGDSDIKFTLLFSRAERTITIRTNETTPLTTEATGAGNSRSADIVVASGG
jgi:hypothetical protein